jgi:hypothetical protein
MLSRDVVTVVFLFGIRVIEKLFLATPCEVGEAVTAMGWMDPEARNWTSVLYT